MNPPAIIPGPSGHWIKLTGVRGSARVFQSQGRITYLGSSRTSLRFIEESWNGVRRLTFDRKGETWRTTRGTERFVLRSHRVGDHPLPTLIEYRSKRPRSGAKEPFTPGLILHLHGGPESSEFGEPRFEGAFPKLVDRGYRYFGWNYPGSIGFGKEWQEKPWGNWEKAMIQAWTELKAEIQKSTQIPISRWVLVGPSFGASVALMISRFEARSGNAFRKVILSSPLLSLKAHAERVKSLDPSQLDWFKPRFSAKDYESLELVECLSELKVPISLIYSGRDEVLGTETVDRAAKSALASSYWRRVLRQARCSHSPRSSRARRERDQFILHEVEN